MEVMNKVADKHGFKVLFHEKPYKGVNGSGKHNNWSISTNTGINLLDCNKANEIVFMLAFTSVISAIDKHYDLLKMSTSSLGNDLRLGGSEAPPSIISVFVGDDMSEMMEDFVKSNKVKKKKGSILDMKTSSVAKTYKDNCDRNRTTPFAYTGNKFEFRMVGSSQSIAFSNTVLATIVADEFKLINERLQKSKSVDQEVVKIIIDNITNHSRIIFNGNSYDDNWAKEAKSRGLIDYKNSVECYKRLLDENNIKLFEDSGVLSNTEVKVRYDTFMETYISDCLIEAKTLVDMCKKQVLPSIEKYINKLIDTNNKLEKFGVKNKEAITKTKNLIESNIILSKKVKELVASVDTIKNKNKIEDKADYCQKEICKIMLEVRDVYDNIEVVLPDVDKPFPNYDDILFLSND